MTLHISTVFSIKMSQSEAQSEKTNEKAWDEGFTVVGRRAKKERATRQAARKRPQNQKSVASAGSKSAEGGESKSTKPSKSAQPSKKQGAKRAGPRPDHEEYKKAMKMAEAAALEELKLPKKYYEDRVTEARYTLNDRTGVPNRNWSIRTDKVLYDSLGDAAHVPRELAWDKKAEETEGEKETGEKSKDDDGAEHQRSDVVSDILKVGPYSFSRKKFYANRYFNHALNEWYQTNWDHDSNLRRFTDRRSGAERWTLQLYWD